MINLRNNCEET